MALDPSVLAERDARGYEILDALTAVGEASKTLTQAQRFVCIDGRTYWVKRNAQSGLVVEVIGGRLARRLSTGPATSIIRVTAAAAGGAAHLIGIAVGSEDVPEAFNYRDRRTFFPDGNLPVERLDPTYLARVVAFQTWIGVTDQQILIRLTDGAVLSIDHGACFQDTADPFGSPRGVILIPDLPDNDGRRADYILPAVAGIEALTEDDLLNAVACIPSGEEWQSSPERRLSIARWLQGRQGRLRGVIESWMRT